MESRKSTKDNVQFNRKQIERKSKGRKRQRERGGEGNIQNY